MCAALPQRHAHSDCHVLQLSNIYCKLLEDGHGDAVAHGLAFYWRDADGHTRWHRLAHWLADNLAQRHALGGHDMDGHSHADADANKHADADADALMDDHVNSHAHALNWRIPKRLAESYSHAERHGERHAN